MSKLLLTVDHQFVRTPDGKVWVKTIYGYDFWKRYLEVFDEVRVAARVRDIKQLEEKMLLASGNRVEFYPLPQYRGPFEFAKKYFKIKKSMRNAATTCDCAIFRIPSPIASGICKEVKKKRLPWAVEVVNDPWDTFAPGSYKSITRPFVRLFFTNQVKVMARTANGASYVTQYALQKRYPSYAKLNGESKKYFESYYSSINLSREYFVEQHKQPKAPYTIVHVNSCITDYSKGHDIVIKMLKIIREKGVDAKVVFVGDGPARNEFEGLANKLGVGKFVSFTGLLSSANDVRNELVNADIMVFPTKGEGLPRTVIEAMAVGLPVLSTPVNGIPELLKSECLFDQQDVEAFSIKTMELLEDLGEYEMISNENIGKALEYVDSALKVRRFEFYSNLKRICANKVSANKM